MTDQPAVAARWHYRGRDFFCAGFAFTGQVEISPQRWGLPRKRSKRFVEHGFGLV